MGSKFNRQPFTKTLHFKVGMPILLLVVVGSFGLREFTMLRYLFKKSTTVDNETVKKLMKPKGSVTLESEYEKIKKLDINNWTNIRGPRLFDETSK